MLTPADYLELTPAQARLQWTRILGRQPAAAGVRQEDFTPVETILCLAASFTVDHSHYGGNSSARAPGPVPELADCFRRPPFSVLAKMANLDGTRSNGARHEPHVAAVLYDDRNRLAALVRIAVAAARSVGLTESQLPDLSDAHTTGTAVLEGQDELEAADVESAVRTDMAKWAAERPDVPPADTERMLIGAVRIGQHRFAGRVLGNFGYRCGFCGLRGLETRPGVRGLLAASHIKPWRDSDHRERLDFRNGIAACPTHDVAFDTGLLTVTADLRIRVSAALERATTSDPAASAAFGRPPLADRLLLPAGALPPATHYLTWHQANVFLPG